MITRIVVPGKEDVEIQNHSQVADVCRSCVTAIFCLKGKNFVTQHTRTLSTTKNCAYADRRQIGGEKMKKTILLAVMTLCAGAAMAQVVTPQSQQKSLPPASKVPAAQVAASKVPAAQVAASKVPVEHAKRLHR